MKLVKGIFFNNEQSCVHKISNLGLAVEIVVVVYKVENLQSCLFDAGSAFLPEVLV